MPTAALVLPRELALNLQCGLSRPQPLVCPSASCLLLEVEGCHVGLGWMGPPALGLQLFCSRQKAAQRVGSRGAWGQCNPGPTAPISGSPQPSVCDAAAEATRSQGDAAAPCPATGYAWHDGAGCPPTSAILLPTLYSSTHRHLPPTVCGKMHQGRPGREEEGGKSALLAVVQQELQKGLLPWP